jgi:hypothetical protein
MWITVVQGFNLVRQTRIQEPWMRILYIAFKMCIAGTAAVFAHTKKVKQEIHHQNTPGKVHSHEV